MNLDFVTKVAVETRGEFESGEVDNLLLKKLYTDYNFVENIDLFVNEARTIFPNLNCGLASVYLKHKLGQGVVHKGKFGLENHTFLLLDKEFIVDITADQYNGPKVYVGKIRSPWAL